MPNLLRFGGAATAVFRPPEIGNCRLMKDLKAFYCSGNWSKDTPARKVYPSAGFEGRAAARPFFVPKILLGFLPVRLNA